MARLQISSIVAGFKPDSTDWPKKDNTATQLSAAQRHARSARVRIYIYICVPSCNRSKDATRKPVSEHAFTRFFRRNSKRERFCHFSHHNVVTLFRVFFPGSQVRIGQNESSREGGTTYGSVRDVSHAGRDSRTRVSHYYSKLEIQQIFGSPTGAKPGCTEQFVRTVHWNKREIDASVRNLPS